MKALVLLSGGLDSSVNLFIAHAEGLEVRALTFLYGQRSQLREKQSAEKLCAHLHIPHQVVELPFFKDFTSTALVNHSSTLPKAEAVSIDDKNISDQTAKAVWVPNRNGIFLNVAAAFAESWGAKWIIPGFNLEEATTFPDNSENYLQALNQSLHYSTYNSSVEAKCFTTSLNKTAIYKKGLTLGLPFDFLWPCYEDGTQWCRQCESCQRFLRAQQIAQNQV